MAKITKGEHGLLADGNPIDESMFSELSDADLEEATGGIKVYTYVDEQSFFTDKSWLVCDRYNREDFDLVRWVTINQVVARCTRCGNEMVVEFR